VTKSFIAVLFPVSKAATFPLHQPYLFAAVFFHAFSPLLNKRQEG